MHIHVGRSAQTIPPHTIVVIAGEAAMVKKFVMQCNRQAWDVVSRHAVEDLVECCWFLLVCVCVARVADFATPKLCQGHASASQVQ